MILRKYLDALNEMVKENEKLLDMDVIYSSDDEGNCYRPVTFFPLGGHFEMCEFDNSVEEEDINAVCIN